ncbi:MAG: cadmium-translocating P-type ATPase [Clostridia bacterium]|nr:cadmium-translocating P-type ATPase [Clostridia bacterium]
MKEFIKENKVTLLRLIISVVLVVGAMLMGHFNGIAALVVYILAYLTASCFIIYHAFFDLFKSRRVGENLLMTVASVASIAIGEYFEACLISILFVLGELIEDLAVCSSYRGVRKLESMRPDSARIKGEEERRPAKDVKIGEIIEVLAGEKIPLDGVILDGSGSVDTSLMTGESTPVKVHTGCEVLAGYINLGGVLTIKVIRTMEQSASQRIIDLSQAALDKKTKNEKFIRKFANIYTPIVILLSLVVALVPPLLDGFNFVKWIYRACSLLAISCPCALVISVPLAYFCSIGYASKRGILVKSSAVMESVEKINTIAFDKTGTLTRPELHVNIVESVGKVSKVDILKYVCIAEKRSSHPVAIALSKAAKKFNIPIEDGKNYREYEGKGVECDSTYGHIMAGSSTFVDATTGTNIGNVFVSLNGEYLGYIGVGDELKGNSRLAFDHLYKLGVSKRIILSGDKKTKVDMVARVLGATEAYSNLLPQDKLSAIEDIYDAMAENEEKCCLAYCGDGINDLPALSRADVGIAMGALGSDAAIEKSDIVIMDDDVDKIPLVMRIAKKAKRVVLENIGFAIGAKAVLLALSIAGILPLYGAVLGDVGILLLSVLNALRAGR